MGLADKQLQEDTQDGNGHFIYRENLLLEIAVRVKANVHLRANDDAIAPAQEN